MAMNLLYNQIIMNYECEAWLVEDADRDVDPSFLPDEPQVFIQIHSQTTPNDDDSIWKIFILTRDYVLNNSSSWSTIVYFFNEMKIPFYFHASLLQKINESAKECQDLNHKLTQINVGLCTLYDEDYDAFSESFNSQRLMFVGASKSAIEALEKVKIEKKLTKLCVICFEDFPIGSEATCMPCKHIYHQNCISNWLENSNCCPLCRSQVPPI
ncbi:uncharacterized protein LOC126674451 [Mercurialis annua]|uniref:uncharacterized protein LOC126674451 n=1 Tax=Mercurialis annua TaxID=3986 RepID=UPI00215FA9F3|nr:uncharacterized protein LOC126674451 [Mercurialis annua]